MIFTVAHLQPSRRCGVWPGLAVRWWRGTATTPTLPGGDASSARDVNDHGVILGARSSPPQVNGCRRALLTKVLAVQDFQPLPARRPRRRIGSGSWLRWL